jgi:hypothetical protein
MAGAGDGRPAFVPCGAALAPRRAAAPRRTPTGRPIRRRLADSAVGLVLSAGFSEADAAVVSLLLRDYVISVVSDEIRIEAYAACGDSAQSPAESAEMFRT